MRAAYVSFSDEDAIIKKLHKDRYEIEELFVQKLSFSEVINTAIGSNTFRVFRGAGTTRPSSLFKKWAFSRLGQEGEIKSKLCVETTEEFDLFFLTLSDDLLETWNKELSGMNEFRSRKMVALLLKNFCFWEGFDDAELRTYIKKVPLPLDSRTLSAIRLPYNKVGNYKIPMNPTMGFINQEEKYIELQKYIHYLAEKARIPAIYLDYLYFDFKEKE